MALLGSRRTNWARLWIVVVIVLLVAAGCSSSPETEEVSEPAVEASIAEPAPTAVPSASPTPTSQPDSPPTPPQVAEPDAPPAFEPAVEAVRELFPLPAQPPDVAWPTEAWPIGPLPDVIDADGLDELMTSTFEGTAFGEIQAVLMVLGGELVLERYGHGYLGTESHASFSMSKSVTHSLLGVLVQEGKIDIDEPAAIEEWAGDDRAAITPNMLLQMSSGLAWVESIDSWAEWNQDSGATAGLQVDRELANEPGTTFNYSTGSTGLLGRVMTDVVGRGQQFDAWAYEALFDPLGIESATLGYDTDGVWLAGSRADMTARDFARFGLLYLRGGTWNGQQLLAPEWIDYARQPSTVSGGDYGAGFWTFPHDANDVESANFYANGLEGQFIVVSPARDLVVVILARNRDEGRTSAFIRNFGALFTWPEDEAD